MSSRGDSREKILHTASRLFQLQGYHATGLNQIVKESGAPKGSLYHFFPNGKEELAIEAVTYTGKCIEDIIRHSMDKITDPVEAIQLFIKETASQFDSKESIQGIPVGLLASETALISEPLRTVCMKVFKSWEAVFAGKLMQNGFDEEEASKLGMLINSMIEGGIMLSLTNKNKAPLLLIAEQIPVLVRKKG
ncbi:TetR/AcrR family transcriptional regulator [Bacillus atrophaeus]|uniref:TetR/AcrR family transcriptional regulator n=1 Tax=Bacillus atrophaeus TaxID=1452 RepID=UPI000D045B76|nr:TetR/AcrR family transcriptional regulator [Bacillus atrophaeus]MCY8519389.1 TetR/AcrR family transcriptional regulator [Bacillus atrophaeus]PRS01572.1 TetR/AcrR family transcriptional regulator [Bacillus atrophaeus]PSA90184.1 TetR/AcrR family transcriptional regulator [Bacillus atrophaeus]